MIILPLRAIKTQPNNFLPGCSGGKQPQGASKLVFLAKVNINISKNRFMSVLTGEIYVPHPQNIKKQNNKTIWDSDCFVCIQIIHGGGWGADCPQISLTHTCMPALHLLACPPFYVSVCNEGDMTGQERMQSLQGTEVTNGREREE